MMTQFDWDAIDAVVFDAVGTLIEPFPSVAESYALAARRQGVAIDLAEVKSRFHKQFRDDEAVETGGLLVTDEATEQRRWRRIVGNVLTGLPDPDRAFAELWQHFGQARAWRCFDDVEPALEVVVGSGRAVCVASNFDRRLRTVVAGLQALDGLVDSLVISSEVGFRKPHPAFYQAVCRHLAPPAARILWVGDDAENDVAGPSRAGLHAVLLDRQGDARGVSDRRRISSLSSLAARL